MEKQPNVPKVTRNLPVSNTVTDGPHVPVIYFDGIVGAAHRNGVIGATLVVQRQVVEAGIARMVNHAVADVRGSIPAIREYAAHLLAVADDAERNAMLAATPTGPAN